MFQKQKIKKRLNNLLKVVSFKSNNPQSYLYCSFSVRKVVNNDYVEYVFLGFKIKEDIKTKTIYFYENEKKLIEKKGFFIDIEREPYLINEILDHIDSKINYF